jgi:hypothetical protein
VIDIGGGNGTVVKHLAGRHPHLDTIVFERQSVVDAALRDSNSAGPPLRFVSGDLFDGESFKKLRGADAVILKRILHDWSDEECVKILKNARSVMHSKSRLFVVDIVIGDGDRDGLIAPKLIADLSMLAMVNGRERTRTDFAELFRKAGLELTSCSDVLPLASIVEAQTLHD